MGKKSWSMLRFSKLRKDKLHEKLLFPTRRPRHEKVDIKSIVKKSEEQYIDFQDAPHSFKKQLNLKSEWETRERERERDKQTHDIYTVYDINDVWTVWIKLYYNYKTYAMLYYDKTSHNLQT